HVVYGILGLKTHSKTTLVVRSESDGIRCYAHIGTGNYHVKTARLFTIRGKGLVPLYPRSSSTRATMLDPVVYQPGDGAHPATMAPAVMAIRLRQRLVFPQPRERTVAGDVLRRPRPAPPLPAPAR